MGADKLRRVFQPSNEPMTHPFKAPPDGYTVILGDVGCMSMAPGLYSRLPYDPLRDFAPVSLVGRSPLVLTVGTQSPLQSLQDLTAAAQAAPGKLNYPSSGTGGPNHLGAELYAMQAKVKVSHIPYKGSAPSVVSLVAGETDFGFLTAVTIASQLNAGKVRALAVANDKRLPQLPDVPTMAEVGHPELNLTSWTGLAAPAGTPESVVQTLYKAVRQVATSPAMVANLKDRGVIAPEEMPPAAFEKMMADRMVKFGAVVKRAGITAE